MERGSIASLNWDSLAVRGLIVKLFALCFVVYPFIGLYARVLIFAVFALIFGFFSMWSVFRIKLSWLGVLELLEGLISIIISLLVFSLPRITGQSLMFFIATWAILTGVSKIVLSVVWKKEIPHRWLPRIAGLVSVFVGWTIFRLPEKDILESSLFIGAYTFVFGLFFLSFALDIRELQTAQKR